MMPPVLVVVALSITAGDYFLVVAVAVATVASAVDSDFPAVIDDVSSFATVDPAEFEVQLLLVILCIILVVLSHQYHYQLTDLV